MKLWNFLKKLTVLVICLAVCCSFAACNITLPEILQKPAQEEQPLIQPEVTDPEDPEMTLAEFMEKVEGIWIFDGTVELMYEDQYCFEVLVIGDQACSTAVYPGGYDRPGKIEEFHVIEENVVQLSLLYEEGEFMGDFLPEAHDTLTITLLEEGKIKAQYSQGFECVLTFGGSDFDEAHTVARILAEA